MPIPEPLLKGARRDYPISHLIEMAPTDPTMPSQLPATWRNRRGGGL